jgi:Domain of unknown function DUF488
MVPPRASEKRRKEGTREGKKGPQVAPLPPLLDNTSTEVNRARVMENASRLFTIGHSTLDLGAFLAALRKFEISLLVDVRSNPRSLRSPHFSQPEFELNLRDASIRYLFLGEELGGRPDDPKAYCPDGMVNYRERRKSFGFVAGIERVLMELERDALVLMCAEEDPINCHRFLMICPELLAVGVDPLHIRKGPVFETQREAEDRLLRAHHLGDVAGLSLFASDRAAALEDAYDAQAKKCAFRTDPYAVEYW